MALRSTSALSGSKGPLEAEPQEFHGGEAERHPLFPFHQGPDRYPWPTHALEVWPSCAPLSPLERGSEERWGYGPGGPGPQVGGRGL